jgi:hypothetical protein
MSGAVIPMHVPRIVHSDCESGWLVVYRSFGWLFGSRREALIAARELALEVRR